MHTRDESVPGGFAAKVLDTVRNRGSTYGHPQDNHQLTADLYSSWASRRFGQEIRFTPEDVCILNILQKMSRVAFATHDDSLLDVAGYAENIGMLRKDQRNHPSPLRDLPGFINVLPWTPALSGDTKNRPAPCSSVPGV